MVTQAPEWLEDVRELVPVAAQRRIWNTLIACEHWQGLVMFAKAQMRYLVAGGLCALGFPAAAVRLEAHGRWIGWSDTERQALLDVVVRLRIPTKSERSIRSKVNGRSEATLAPLGCIFDSASVKWYPGDPGWVRQYHPPSPHRGRGPGCRAGSACAKFGRAGPGAASGWRCQ